MKNVGTVARYLLGLGFLVFGLNGFLDFLPPPEISEQGGQFLGLMAGSGIYLTVVKILEVVGGLLLVAGRYVALGITLLGPIVVNIVLFHLAFDPATIGMAALFAILWLIVFWDRRASFKALWAA